MTESPNSLTQQCPTCGALLDVAGEEPFALMHCPTCGEAMRVRRNFDHFELQEMLGSGGMGTVYRALDKNLGRQVALKLLRKEQSANPEFIAQFEKEAAITASITHPHVVKVFSTGQDNGLVYIAMELVDKGSLDDLLSQEEPPDEVRILTTGIQIAEGLNAAYKRGLIHRDVKPGNILFANARTAKIVDFGLAVLAEHAGTVMGDVWGTPAYVAPEKLDGQPEDLRSDIYSLGATLYHALAGVPPCDIDTDQMSVLLAAKRNEPSLITAAPKVADATAMVIDRTLKFDPADRFQTYEDLVGSLEYARSQAVAATHAAETASRTPHTDMRWITIGAIAAVVALGLGIFKLTRSAPPPPPVVIEEPEGPRGVGIDGQYQAARALLAGGDWVKAAAAFKKLEAAPNTPQPRLNWITLHIGLAEFLAGHPKEGREAFARMEARGPFSADPTEQRQADFFVQLAKLAASEEPVPASAVQELDLEGENFVALFVLAAKNWALEDFDNAGPQFRQFATATPKAAWVAEYQALARPRAADCAVYLPARDAAKSAETMEQRVGALAMIVAARRQVVHLEGIPAKLDALAVELREKVEKEKAEMAEKQLALEAADAAALADLKTRLQGLCAQFKYTDAFLAAKALTPQTETGRQQANLMLRKTEWLARFKATLIGDLSVVGYPAPLVRKNGSQIPGPVRRADETQVGAVSQFGAVLVPWTDLAPECIFAMGQSFLQVSQPPDKLADRTWYLGVYAYFSGKDSQGRELLIQATQGKEEYREHLGLFLSPAEMPKE
jgi:hypothetical protein